MKHYFFKAIKKLDRPFAYTAGIGAALLIAGGVYAWSGPPTTPPGCPSGYTGCDQPLNVSGTAQSKSGTLTLSTVNVATKLDMGASGAICLGGVCNTAWPSAGGTGIQLDTWYPNATNANRFIFTSAGVPQTAFMYDANNNAYYLDADASSKLNSVTTNALTVGGQNVCLANGTNCPAAGSFTDTDTLGTVVARGNSTSGGIAVGGIASAASGSNWAGTFQGSAYGIYAAGSDRGAQFFNTTNNAQAFLAYGGYSVYSGYPAYFGGSSGTWAVQAQGTTHGIYGNGSTYGIYGNSSSVPGFFVNSSTGATAYLAYSSYGLYTGSSVIASAYYYQSDERLKKNIAALKDSLNKVLALQGVTYEWKDAAKGKGTQVGFIAQQVEQVVPELVSTDPETGIKAVDYAKVTPLLVEAIKTQQQEIDALKAEVEALKAR